MNSDNDDNSLNEHYVDPNPQTQIYASKSINSNSNSSNSDSHTQTQSSYFEENSMYTSVKNPMIFGPSQNIKNNIQNHPNAKDKNPNKMKNNKLPKLLKKVNCNSLCSEFIKLDLISCDKWRTPSTISFNNSVLFFDLNKVLDFNTDLHIEQTDIVRFLQDKS